MFFIWSIIQFSILFILFLIVLTQIILPPFLDMPYFWLFRKEEKELLKAIDDLAISKIKQETNSLKEQKNKIDK